MNSCPKFPCFDLIFFTVLLLLVISNPISALNEDGVLLLAFKYSVLSDPLSTLQNWNYEDQTPCPWTGITCDGFSKQGTASEPRVVSVALRDRRIVGEIPFQLGMIEHLKSLDLSNNLINGTLPTSLFKASELRELSLANNLIRGGLPDSVQGMQSLRLLNLSDNSFTGEIPRTLSSLRNLTVLSLKNNYLSGDLPSGFDGVEVLDLSSNLINGTLPINFGGQSVQFLNLSRNSISGQIPINFANKLRSNTTIDLSFNNFSGEVPETELFLSLKPKWLAGNPNLCGKPLTSPCFVSSNSSNSTRPAIAAIPINSNSSTPTTNSRKQGLKPGAIAGIVAGDVAIIGVLSVILIYAYKSKKKNRDKNRGTDPNTTTTTNGTSNTTNSNGLNSKTETHFNWPCFNNRGSNTSEDECSQSSDGVVDKLGSVEEEKQRRKDGTFVAVDGETEVELETLLRASAYIIGASGSSIVYKAVLEDGTTFAVRRIGESKIERFKEFEAQVRLIAKVRHPNLVRLRGFYWGSDEKLVIYDYVPNGSLANLTYRKKRASTSSSSSFILTWEARLKIARGVARALTYLHEKKHVHGNIKPSNILLGLDMEPRISDYGVETLVWGDSINKMSGSTHNFGSHRSTASAESLQDLQMGASPSPMAESSYIVGPSSYRALESLKNIKPNQKWDVYSFGVVLLELLTGKVASDQELGQWNSGYGLEDPNRVLRMVDVVIKEEVEGKEESLLMCFKLEKRIVDDGLWTWLAMGLWTIPCVDAARDPDIGRTGLGWFARSKDRLVFIAGY
ncbi:hypothetical protein Sjap_017367 [Stephania japonica]|uniref:Protein kinase domain-containing protein n=1 Tax=Stephania japonica TaxID=461633 RepID=A0AAP0I612_9MAGN